MIAFSLLPPEKKERIRHEQRYRQYLFILLTFGIALALMASSVIATRILLERSLQRTNEQIQREDAAAGRPSNSTLIKRVKLYQETLTKLALPAQSRTSMIVEMTKAVSPGVTLSALRLSIDDMSVVLEGSAVDRPSLLVFQQALRALPFIQSLETPISALAKKGDLTFTLQAHLKID